MIPNALIHRRESHGDAVAGPALDRFGIAASVACAIHCAGALALVSTSGLGLLLADEHVELGLAMLAAVLAGFALTAGRRRHGRWTPALVGLAGLCAILLGRVTIAEGSVAERACTVAGAALLVAGHALNLRAHRRCAARSASVPSEAIVRAEGGATFN